MTVQSSLFRFPDFTKPARLAGLKVAALTKLALVLSVVCFSLSAEAQPCCAGANAVMPARLTLHEDALVGLSLRPTLFHGSFDGNRRYLPNPESTAEVSFQEDLLGALRLLEKGQVALAVPLIQTYRRAPGLSEVGVGLGDISLTGRWDFTLAGESARIPGLALLAGVMFPTGRPPEASQLPLLTDATGVGAFQLSLGAGVEQSWGSWFFTGNALASQPLPRRANGIAVLLGTQLSALAAAGYGFDNEAAVALSVTYAASRDTRVDGAFVPGSGRARLLFGISGSYPLHEDWRLQGSLYDALPIWGVGRNEPAGFGLSVVLVRSWT